MATPVGPAATRFFKRCDHSDAKIGARNRQTRLFQDIGLMGDSAWEEFTTMHRVFGVLPGRKHQVGARHFQ